MSPKIWRDTDNLASSNGRNPKIMRWSPAVNRCLRNICGIISAVLLLQLFVQSFTISSQTGYNELNADGLLHAPIWRSFSRLRYHELFQTNEPKRNAPLILFWTQFFSRDVNRRHILRKQAESGIASCSVSNCRLTSDRRRLPKSAAVIFHIRDIKAGLPKYRRTDQYYVFYLLESPFHTEIDLSAFREFFNLTYTYRQDSDIYDDGYLREYQPQLWNSSDSQFDALWTRKTGFAAYFSSYCNAPSRRQDYVNELTQYLPVDSYGSCGTLRCEMSQSRKCDRMLVKYKFYLAFENSVCKDYVTEKILRAYNHGLIPVVYGGVNYTALLPPDSFINVLDFLSVKLLAEHLIFLSNNRDAYAQYFKWRTDPQWLRLRNQDSESNGWCKLCKFLNQRTNPPKVYTDLDDWWHNKASCKIPRMKEVYDESVKITRWESPIVMQRQKTNFRATRLLSARPRRRHASKQV